MNAATLESTFIIASNFHPDYHTNVELAEHTYTDGHKSYSVNASINDGRIVVDKQEFSCRWLAVIAHTEIVDVTVGTNTGRVATTEEKRPVIALMQILKDQSDLLKQAHATQRAATDNTESVRKQVIDTCTELQAFGFTNDVFNTIINT